MADNPIKLVNENGRIVGKDSQTGDTIPIEFDSISTGELLSDKAKAEQRIHAMYEANVIRANAGLGGVPAGVAANQSAGLSDPSAPSSQSRITITAESDASGLADSGSGTESDPYIIRDRLLDNSEGSLSSGGIYLSDPDASYHVKFVNCEVSGYSTAQIDSDFGTEPVFESCLIYSGGTTTYGAIVRGGDIRFSKTEFGGCGDYAVSSRNGAGTISVKNTKFTNNQENHATSAINPCEATELVVKRAEFTDSNISDCVQWKAPTDISITFERVIANGPRRGIRIQDGHGGTVNLSVDYFKDNTDRQGVLFYGPGKDVTVTNSYFNDSNDGYRLCFFREGQNNDPVEDVTVRRCKFTKSTGTASASNEALESWGCRNVDFEECWITECVEDGIEHAYPYENCNVRRCVIDDCKYQMVDYFGAKDPNDLSDSTGFDINSEVANIYGNSIEDVPVLITDCDNVTVHDVYGEAGGENVHGNGYGVCLRQANGSAGVTPDNCRVFGTLPLDEVTINGPFGTVGDVGSNNEVAYFDNEQIQTPLGNPDTSIR